MKFTAIILTDRQSIILSLSVAPKRIKRFFEACFARGFTTGGMCLFVVHTGG